MTRRRARMPRPPTMPLPARRAGRLRPDKRPARIPADARGEPAARRTPDPRGMDCVRVSSAAVRTLPSSPCIVFVSVAFAPPFRRTSPLRHGSRRRARMPRPPTMPLPARRAGRLRPDKRPARIPADARGEPAARRTPDPRGMDCVRVSSAAVRTLPSSPCIVFVSVAFAPPFRRTSPLRHGSRRAASDEPRLADRRGAG